VINQNPVGGSNPLGPQAPDKPEGSRPDSSREAIQRAFDKAAKTAEAKPEARAKPAMGHNNPPEETKKEQPKLDLRQPPQRGEGGKFAPRNAPGTQAAESERVLQPGQQQAAHKQLPETAPYREPPPRFSEGGKSEWAAAPESVRGDVYRMHQEFEGAYKRYRGDHDEMNKIRHFHQMAQQHGTTLDRALDNYTTMERKLREDPLGGFDMITNNLGLKSSDGRPITFRDICWHVVNQTPEQLQLMQSRNAQQSSGHQIGALHQKIEGLESTLQQMHHAQQFTYTRSAVDQFADSHPRFDELGDLIEQELAYGHDLQTAYARAALLRPESSTQAAQTRTSNAPAQTRSDKSISGAPESPSNGAARKSGEKPVGRRDAIQNAIRRVNGAFA